MIYYVSGILAGAFLPELPADLWLLFLCPLFFYGPWRRITVPFWFGLLLAVTYGYWQLWHRLDVQRDGRDHLISGEVVGLPVVSSGVQRFELRVLAQQRTRLRRVRLSVYVAMPLLEPGDVVALSVRLKPPHSLWNPDGFDYELWALSRGIDAAGYVRRFEALQGRRQSIDRLRASLGAALSEGFDDPVVAGLARAFLIGDGSGLAKSDWDVLRRTGTVHLVVVSGLHIGILVAVGWLLGRGLLWLCPARWLTQRLLRLFPLVLALSLSGLYVLLAGSGLATLRAWIMVAALLLSGFCLIQLSVWQRWWLALAIVLSMQPLAVHAPGLWLSFGAVAVLLMLSAERCRQPLWMLLLRTQLAIFCLMTPLLLGWFAQISLIAPLINLIAIPLLPLLVLGLLPVLLGMWSDVDFPLRGYEAGVGWLWRGLEALSQGFGSGGIRFVPHVELLLLALLAAVVVVLPLAARVRLLAAGIWLLALFGTQTLAPPPGFRAWVFDVGQGLAVWVQAGEHGLLYDTGPGYGSGATAFERTVLPYLQRNGIRHVDRFVVSHADNDHAGGREQVRDALIVGERESGSRRLQGDEGYRPCQAGVSWRWSGVSFRYLHGGEGRSENDQSCVLLIETPECRLLLTGDIEAGVEAALVAQAVLQPVTWLVASHHGSRSSSTAAFLATLQPDYGLFSAGFLNPYKHPAPEVISRFADQGALMFNTAHSGALELIAEPGERCRIRAWRSAKKRYWSAG